MKTINKLFMGAGILMALTLSSCDIKRSDKEPFDLTTETLSSFDESVVFSNYSLTENSIYGILNAFAEMDSYRTMYCCWYGYNTDIENYSSTTFDGSKLNLVAYDHWPNNSVTNTSADWYANMFLGVERANLCIKGIRKYGNESIMPLLGEALTLRAVLYADLLRTYGEVPARFEPVGPETIYLNKSDRDVIFKQILADLEEAIPLLPLPANTVHTGRPSRAFAEGLYARLALAASGYGLRPDEGKVGTGNMGSIRLSNDPELQKSVLYPKALAYLKDCISNSGLSLYDSYEQLWRDFNNIDMTPGKEIIFSIPFGNGRGRWNWAQGVRVEANTTAAGGTSSRGAYSGPNPTLFYKYSPNDVRRDLSCIPYRWIPNDVNGDTQELWGGTTWSYGKYRLEWMEKNPYTGGNDDGIKPVYMRYSDVLLMAAEIANELNEFDFAKAQLLAVRQRAFKGHEQEAADYVNSLTQGESFFNAIVEERALEFVGEMLRKGDLIRWNLLKKKLDEVKAEMAQMANRTGKYTELPDLVYTRYKADKVTLEIYGLELGQTANPGEGWEATEFFPKSKDGVLPDSFQKKIASIYLESNNPEQMMWWPINAQNISASLGNLVNDYGY